VEVSFSPIRRSLIALIAAVGLSLLVMGNAVADSQVATSGSGAGEVLEPSGMALDPSDADL